MERSLLLSSNQIIKITVHAINIFVRKSSLFTPPAFGMGNNPAGPASVDSPMYSMQFGFFANRTRVISQNCCTSLTGFYFPAIFFHGLIFHLGFLDITALLQTAKQMPMIRILITC